MEVICPKCHTSNPDRFKFCGECGYKMDTPSASLQEVLEIEGERKNVTILFSDLSGYTAMTEKLDPEQVKDIISQIFEGIEQVVAQYEGFIEKFIGDAVVAFFGVPKVHEDDPVRAILVAKKIHALVKNISPKLEEKINTPVYMHTGINTGLVVTGELNLKEGTHGIVGEAVNIASRLSDIAKPDEILISDKTYKLVHPYFKTIPLKQVKLKGISRLVDLHQVMEELKVKTRFEASRSKGFFNFIGRDRELNKLFTCLEETIAGNGQIVTVIGEAGVGKSRLIYEFRHNMDRQKIIVLQGRCHSYGKDIPYLPFLDALKRGLSLREENTPSQLEEQIISNILAIDPSLEEFLPLYLHLLSIPTKQYRIPNHLQGPKLKKSIEQALANIILFNTKRKPMVLVLEDWHWVDEASNSTLKFLVNLMKSYQLMIIVLCRPGCILNLDEIKIHSQCFLKAMDLRNTKNIIKTIWNVDKLPDDLSSFIHNHTGGNPFFIEEICKALSEDGSVRVKNNKMILENSLEELMLPDTVQAVIRARLDRLDIQSKKTLKLASVIGREFSLRNLEKISGNNKHNLTFSLDVLKTQELIQPNGLLPDGEFMFKHALTQVAVYKSLLLKKRKEYHDLVGKALEELYPDRLGEKCENLAFHYSNSLNTGKAMFYLEMAGDKAAGVHSLSEARKYYKTGLSILNKGTLDSKSRQTYIDFALRWAEASQYAPSNKIRKALGRSLEYARTLNKQNRIAEVSYWIGKFSYMQGDFIEAVPQVKQCIKWAEEVNNHEQLAVSYNLYGRSGLYIGEYPIGINYLNKGLELIKQFGRWDDVVYSMGILGLLLGLTGEYKKSMKTLAEAIKIARKHEIPTFEAMVFGYLGSIQFWYGNWNAAINNCRQCIDISKKLNNSLPVIWATFFNGAAVFNSGSQEDGLAKMKQSIHMLEKMDSVLALRFFYSALAENLAAYGRFEEAKVTNEKSMELKKSKQRWGEIGNYRTLGILAASGRNPDWHQVDIHVQKSIDLAKRKRAMIELVQSLYSFSVLMQKKGDLIRTQSYYNEAKNLADKIRCKVRQ